MFENKTHSVEDRIVSISQPYLLPDCCTYFLFCTLFGICKCKILFSGYPAVGAGLIPWMIVLVKIVNHILKLLTCFIEKRKILWISYVGWRAGGIKNRCPKIFYVKRDLEYLEDYMEAGYALPSKHIDYYLTIQVL